MTAQQIDVVSVVTLVLIALPWLQWRLQHAHCTFPKLRYLKNQERFRGGLPPSFAENDGLK